MASPFDDDAVRPDPMHVTARFDAAGAVSGRALGCSVPAADDLFASTEGAGARSLPPLAVRMRPASIDEVRGQGDILRPGSPLRRLIEGSGGTAGPLSAILWGPPGTGKTTLAHLVATAAHREFVELSAVTAGSRTCGRSWRRPPATVTSTTARRSSSSTRSTASPRPSRTRCCRGRDPPGHPRRGDHREPVLLGHRARCSRARCSSRSPPSTTPQVADVLDSAVSDARGLDAAYALSDEAREHLVRIAGGDARRALTSLEAAAGVALDDAPAGRDDDEPLTITLAHAEQAVAQASVRYDKTGDQHYDVASAFIKSMRGSDVDAALHYLARQLEAGEDPRFIARRIVIAASEDVGMGDPTALQTAVAAMHAVAQIGMPEARIILAQAVVHNALAPKSNAAYAGINAAIADIRAGRGGAVPPHLRGSGYAGADPSRARQGLRLRPRRGRRRGAAAVPPGRPARQHRLLPADRPRVRGAAAGALDLAQGASGRS